MRIWCFHYIIMKTFVALWTSLFLHLLSIHRQQGGVVFDDGFDSGTLSRVSPLRSGNVAGPFTPRPLLSFCLSFAFGRYAASKASPTKSNRTESRLTRYLDTTRLILLPRLSWRFAVERPHSSPEKKKADHRHREPRPKHPQPGEQHGQSNENGDVNN